MWGLKKQEDNKNSNYRKIGLETNMMSNNGKYQCVHCERYFPKKSIEIDHIIPQSKGGGNQPQNLQCLCKKCNCSKGNDMTLTKSDLKKRKSSYAQYKRFFPHQPMVSMSSTPLVFYLFTNRSFPPYSPSASGAIAVPNSRTLSPFS